MIPTRRLRRLLAPAAGFREAVISASLGLAAFIIGLALSFRDSVKGILDATAGWVQRALEGFLNVDQADGARHMLGGLCLVLGVYLIVQGVRFGLRHLFRTIYGETGGMGDRYKRRLMLAEGPRIVTIGGGTGLSTILRGLKQHSSNITAIVTVSDDGGSSGRLTQEIGIIPPGDIRSCLVALADAEKSMTDLFQHRFTRASGSLSGHSLGNLLITALMDQAGGDFEQAIEIASNVLNIRGQVVPASLNHVSLRALMEDDSELEGETAIVASSKRIRRVFLDPPDARAHKEALAAIRDADLICIGPGSVYTSIVPNLLVPEIAQAVEASRAKKVYVCNVMTQKGESDSFTASEHALAISSNLPVRVFDYVMVNTGVPSPALIERYREAGQHFVEPDLDRIRAMGLKVLPGDYMNESDLVRHDPMRVASRLVQLIDRG